MCRTIKLSLLLILSSLLPFTLGCGRDDFFPKADLVVSLEEFNIIPSNYDDLPISTIEVTPLNGVTSRLTSYSIHYSSYLHEAIPSLAMLDIPISIRIPGSEETNTEGDEVSFELVIYTDKVRDLYLTTPSNIAPIKAEIIFTIDDAHSNTSTITTYANLFKPEAVESDEDED